MLFPSPGATGVSTTFGSIVVAGDSNDVPLELVPAFGSKVATGPVERDESPLPFPTTLPAGVSEDQVYQAVQVPELASASTYTVYETVYGCSGTSVTSIGSFSTQ